MILILSHGYIRLSNSLFNVAFKHPRSYHDGACLKQWYFDQYAATHEYHAEDTNTYINVLGQTRSGNPSPTFHTNQ